jgi:hypothetical protein
MYCLGRRFTTRGSTRPRRDGLTTNTVASASSTPISHRTVSTRLTRSGDTPCNRADSTIADRIRLYASANTASSFSTPSTVPQRSTSIFMVILIWRKLISTCHLR